MKYLIKVSPVNEGIPIVREAYMRIIGSENRHKVHELIHNGGILIDNLTKNKAARIASDLSILFVVNYEVLEMESNDPEADLKNDNLTYEVRLVDAGPSKLDVVKLVKEITDLGLKDSKEIVDNLGVVGLYKTRKEAQQIKKSLTSVGAKVNIQIAEDPAMEPDLNILQRSTFRVKLDSVGGNKMAVIRAVQKILLRVEAESIVEELGTVVDMVSRSTAYKIQEELASAGAKSVIKSTNAPQPELEPEPSPPGKIFHVAGRVLKTDGIPLPQVIVRAFDRRLREEIMLGEAVADKKGQYEIHYEVAESYSTDGQVNLLLRVFGQGRERMKELAVSSVHFNARSTERLDIIVASE